MKELELNFPAGRLPGPDDIGRQLAGALRLSPGTRVSVILPGQSCFEVPEETDVTCMVVRRSLDARGAPVWRYKVRVYRSPEKCEQYELPEYRDVHDCPAVIVVGAGPAGLFASLRLLFLGLRPVILERGRDVHARKIDMALLSREGILDPDSNYCFGEGGAGAFSDGKLFTRSSKRGDIREVLHQLVRFGASPDILLDAHPHIGTDKLPLIVENIRHCIEMHGGEYHFSTKVVDILESADGSVIARSEDGAEYSAKALILATGHSARDVYEMLYSKGWELQAKGFAIGVRAEHPQSVIDRARYHDKPSGALPAAEYSFVEQVDGRGVFSFCMCPGGILVPSSTEEGTVVLNGMSNSARNSAWANAGVVVSVEPEDIPEKYSNDGPFALLNFQRDVERSMYEAVRLKSPSAHPFAAPAQRMTDFCAGRESADLPSSSYRPGAVSVPLHRVLPSSVAARLRKVFPLVGKKIPGYFTCDALLLGTESRTSSPVRIPRNPETLEYVSASRIFPCGEGAGYSGGIVSSAIDGIRCAEAAARLSE